MSPAKQTEYSSQSHGLKRLLLALGYLPQWVRNPVIRSLVRVDQKKIADVVVKQVETAREMGEFARLLHDTFVERGLYKTRHGSGVRITPHLILPSTVHLVAKEREVVIGGLSIIHDSPLGIPMDAMYPRQVGELRGRGRMLVELSAQCVAREHRRKGISFLLNKAMAKYVMAAEVDDLLMVVPPYGVDFHRAVFLFEPLGEPCLYPGLDSPLTVTGMRLDARKGPGHYREVFGRKRKSAGNSHYMVFEAEHPQIRLHEDKRPLTPNEIMAGLISARADAFERLSVAQLDYLRSVLHPDCVRALEGKL